MAIAAPLPLGTPSLALAVAGPMHRMAAAEAHTADALFACVRQIGRHDLFGLTATAEASQG